MSQYASFFAAYKASVLAGNPHSKEEQISIFTNGRTNSLRALSGAELEGLVAQLNMMSRFTPKPQAAPQYDPKADGMRKSIIAIFRSMNRTVADAKAWSEKQGVRGTKRKFNDYSNGELYTLIRIAEKVRSDYQATLRSKMKNL